MGFSVGGDQRAGLGQGVGRRSGCLGLFERWGPKGRAGPRGGHELFKRWGL